MSQEIERRLRDAIHAYTGSVEPAPDGWDRISQQLPRPRGSRRRWPVAIAGAAVVALIATGVVGVRAMRTTGPATGPHAPMPSRIVAVDARGAVVLLNAKTGRVERMISDRADATTSLAVSPDATRVVFDRPAALDECGPTTREVVSVDLTGRAPQTRRLALGATQLAYSPDRKKFAFISYLTFPLDPSACNQPKSIVLNFLDKKGRAAGGRAWPVSLANEFVRGPLSWAPDSRHLLFSLDQRPGPGGLIYPRVLDTRASSVQLEQTPIVPISESTAIDGYLGRTGDLLGTVNIGSGERFRGEQVAAIDPKTGAVHRVLFEIRAIGYTAPLMSDSSGQHILLPTFDRNGQPTGLYRWSEGDKKPTKITDGVTAAAWVPHR